VLPDPVSVPRADVLLVESTYGNREHLEDDRGDELASIITGTAERGGKLIVPAFAIGRVEEVLYWIDRLEEERRIPVLPVYVDSPMAADALKFYSDRLEELDEEMRRDGGRVCAFCTKRFQTVISPKHSREVVESRSPAIVISASGMATGGRVLHHLRHGLPNPKNTVLFVGFQGEGTRGRRLVEGMSEVKIHGEFVPVRARVRKLDSMSAHADQSEILRWLGGFERPPDVTCLVHGEPAPMDALKGVIQQKLGWNVVTPEYLQSVPI
jgi:metallo-beta-lactamase family protein